jgi:asparagine synthetase B (glutamine-hydrolysing)
MSKVKQWAEEEREKSESKADEILNELVQKHYEHESADKIKNEVIKEFKEKHTDLLFTFLDKVSGKKFIDEEVIEISLSETVEDKINEKTKDQMDNNVTERGGLYGRDN